MSERYQPSREERLTQQALRELPGGAPDTDFRARLRDEFVTGASRDGAPESEGRRVVPLRAIVATLAAAAVVASVFFSLNRGPDWRCTDVTGDGSIRIGERVIPAGDALEVLNELVRPGIPIRLEGDVQLDFLASDVLFAQLAPGSAMRLPNTPGRWVGRAMHGVVEFGEVRFSTGPSFAGTRLSIEASGGTSVEVTGTTFAVISAADSACVCVLDGEVDMIDPDGTSTTVRAGRRRSVFTGGRDPVDEPIFPMEQMKLEMLREQAGATEAP